MTREATLAQTMAALSGLSTADVQAEIDKTIAIQKAIDDAWKEGRRDMVRVEVWAVAGALHAMFDAIIADDAPGYLKAAKEAREFAYRAQLHGGQWVKRTKERPDGE